MIRLYVICLLVILAVNLTFWWVIASGITSGIKAMSEDCGQRYGVEVVLGGDWFCPNKED